MFGLQDAVSGEYFDTKDVTVQCVIKGPIFRGEDKQDGSLVFNMTLPASDKNKKLTGFLDRIEGFPTYFSTNFSTPLEEAGANKIAVFGWLNGMQVWTGTMLAKFARPGEIEVSIGMGRGEFNYEAEGKKLRDVVPDEDHVVGNVYAQTDPVTNIKHNVHDVTGFDDVVNYVYPEVNYAVYPVKIDDMCSLLGNAFNNAYYNTTPCVNTWDMDAQKFLHPVLFGNFMSLINLITDANANTQIASYLLAYNIFTPFPYNAWIFKNLFASMGFILENNPFELDEDLKRLTVFNVQTLNEMWTDFTSWVGTFNYSTYIYGLEPHVEFNLRDHVPDIGVKDYLRGLEDMFFVRCFINNKTRRVKVMFLKDVVLSKEYRDITDKVSEIKERRMEFDRISALVQTYDGADGIGGQLKAVSEVQALDRIPDVYDKYGLPVNNLGQYTNKICYAIWEKKWYICPAYSDDFNHISAWEEFNYEYYLQMATNKTGKEWKAEASGIVCSYFQDYRPGTSYQKWEWMIPYCKMPVKFYNTEKSKNAGCSLRFLFYRGMVDGKVHQYGYVEYIKMNTGADADITQYLNTLVFYTVDISGVSTVHELWPSSYTTSMITLLTTMNITYDQLVLLFQNYIDDWGPGHLISDSSTNYNANDIAGHIGANYCYSVMDQSNTSSPPVTTINKYPYGTNDVYDAFGNKIKGANLSTKWDGEYGIYEKLAKPFVQFKNEIAKAVTIVFQPEPEDLYFDFSEKKRLNGVDYLFDEIRLEIRADGSMSAAEADAYSC